MHEKVSLEVKKALFDIANQNENLISIIDSEIFHVVFNDDSDYFFKILKRDITTSHQPIYRAELNPREKTDVNKRFKIIYPENLAKEFKKWIGLIADKRKYAAKQIELLQNLQQFNPTKTKQFNRTTYELDTNKQTEESTVKFGEGNEIILYQPDNSIRLEVRVEKETVWLSLNQMTYLFDRDKSVISRHIKNIFEEEELLMDSTVANFATVQIEGERTIERFIEYYNLDVIISVGYRVKSKRGTQFRQWANRVLKEYLLKGYAINRRIDGVEKFTIETEHRVTEIQIKLDFLKQYIEDVFADYNDINEDTRMKLELINESLAELQVKNMELNKPRNAIGFNAPQYSQD